MKIWLHGVLVIFMLQGYCFAQASSNFGSLPVDWRSKIWVYSIIDPMKEKLEQKKISTENNGITKIHLFKLYKGGSQHVLAFGPFEDKNEAKDFFKINQSDVFRHEYYDWRARTGDELKTWFEIAEDGSIVYQNTKNKTATFSNESTSEQGGTKAEQYDTNAASRNDDGYPNKHSSILDSTIADLDFEERQHAQELLKRLKLYKGGIDGEFGGGTKRAIKDWQYSLSDSETGFLTVAQHRELLKTDNLSKNSSNSKMTIDATSPDNNSNIPSTVPPAQTGSGTNTTESDAPPWPDAEVQSLIAGYERERDEQLEAVEELTNKYEADLRKAKLSLFQTPIKEMIDWKGKLPGELGKDITVEFKEDCLTFVPNDSLEEIIKKLANQTDCVLLSEQNEINTDKMPSSTKTTNLRRQITLNLLPSYPLEISSIFALPNIGSFDIYSCGFNLLFTNGDSGETFDIQMFAEKDGRFEAGQTINGKLKDRNLDPKNNNWENLTVQVKKSQDSNCEPQDNDPASIEKDGSKGRFTISRDGVLKVEGIELTAFLDDLAVFLSKNIGVADDGSGTESFDPNYPFASNLSLQDFYFTHALDALHRYTKNSESLHKHVKIYTAKQNAFVEKAEISLPNTHSDINNSTIFNDKKINLKHVMPDAARALRQHKVAAGTRVLVLGSFGLSSQDLCDHSMYDKITRSRSNAPVTILNFIPFENFSALNYKTVHNAPVTLQCPNRNDVLLIYPNENARHAPEKLQDGFYDLITKGFEK